jgi:hypothetical protein
MQEMEPFYCLIHRPEDVPDLWLLAADNDADALEEMDRRAADWRPFLRIELYQGERRVATAPPLAEAA